MDFLHTDPATGDQYWLSTQDDGPLSFADAQAAVAQHTAATQGGAGASGSGDYGYAPLNSAGSGGSAQAAWTPSPWGGLGYGGQGASALRVPQPYSGDPNNSPALQMLRARAAEAAQRQAAAPPVSPVMLPKAASGQDSAAGDGATADPWSWQNWLLGNEPQAAAAASSGIPSVGTSSWLDWLQNTEPQPQDEKADSATDATNASTTASTTPQAIEVPGFSNVKYTMTMTPVPRHEAGADSSGLPDQTPPVGQDRQGALRGAGTPALPPRMSAPPLPTFAPFTSGPLERAAQDSLAAGVAGRPAGIAPVQSPKLSQAGGARQSRR